jgi:hypothetical protein
MLGTPLIYERTISPHMINIPRALFQSRTGRPPIYHIAIDKMRDWAYTGEPLAPLKGYRRVLEAIQEKKSCTGGLRAAIPLIDVIAKSLNPRLGDWGTGGLGDWGTGGGEFKSPRSDQ